MAHKKMVPSKRSQKKRARARRTQREASNELVDKITRVNPFSTFQPTNDPHARGEGGRFA